MYMFLSCQGRVAQLVEHLTFNQVAPGSNPGTLTKIKSLRISRGFFLREKHPLPLIFSRQKAPRRNDGGF